MHSIVAPTNMADILYARVRLFSTGSQERKAHVLKIKKRNKLNLQLDHGYISEIHRIVPRDKNDTF